MSRLGIDVPGAFTIDVQADGELAVVRVAGELDLSTAGELEQTLIGLSSHRVVIDLASVSFLDSTALGVLLRANGSRSAERPLFLLAPGQELRRVFQITGLERRFRFVSSVDEAVSP
jgi:anti-sigma B factor antagonist